MNVPVVAAVGFLLTLMQFGLMWAVAAAVRLQRRVSIHWAAAMLLPSASLLAVVWRETLGPWPGWLAANLLIGLGMLAVRRGVALFARRPTCDGESAVLVVVHVSALAVAGATQVSAVAVVATSAVCGHALLRAAATVATALAEEFGRLSARLCALPLALIGGLLVARALAASVAPERFGQGVHVGLTFNVWLMILLAALTTLLNMGLASLVVLRLVRRLEHRNAHDPLTEVLNRRGLDAALLLQARRHRRQRRPWALLVVDIDHFKQVNDRHGHAVGDAVLTRVAQTLAAEVRPFDRVGRAGGEEFVVLLPGADGPSAEAVAERLRTAVASLAHPELDPPAVVTVSVGAAVVTAAGDEPPAEVLRRADRALYAAKAAGRDRVVLASPTAPGGRDLPARYG